MDHEKGLILSICGLILFVFVIMMFLGPPETLYGKAGSTKLPPITPDTPSCYDSDSGKIYDIKGSADYRRMIKEDYCLDQVTLREAYCLSQKSNPLYVNYTCPKGKCINGACKCGNGKINPGEDCEGTNLGGKTCRDIGFGSGALSCNQDCRFDTTRCPILISPVKAFNPEYGVATACQPDGVLQPGQAATGLWASGTSGDAIIAGQYVSSCIAADFNQAYSASALDISYRSVNSACGDSCEGINCGTSGTGLVFVSTKPSSQTLLSEWSLLSTLPRQTSVSYKFIDLSQPTAINSVLVCRDGAGQTRDNLEIDNILLEVSPQTSFQGVENTALSLLKATGDYISNTVNFDYISTPEAELSYLGFYCSIFLRYSKVLELNDPKRYLSFKEHALPIADQLIAVKDKNTDGKTGWGLNEAWDAFADETINPIYTEYAYQTPVVSYCLLDAYEATGNKKYLDTVKEAMTTFSNEGTSNVNPECDNCYYYWYSVHENDEGRLVKNTNSLMGLVLARLCELTGSADYCTRATSIHNTEIYEAVLRNNLGYVGYDDVSFDPAARTYYVFFEMWGIDELGRVIGQNNPDYLNALKRMAESQWDSKYCNGGICEASMNEMAMLAACYLAHHGGEYRSICDELTQCFNDDICKGWSVHSVLGLSEALPIIGCIPNSCDYSNRRVCKSDGSWTQADFLYCNKCANHCGDGVCSCSETKTTCSLDCQERMHLELLLCIRRLSQKHFYTNNPKNRDIYYIIKN